MNPRATVFGRLATRAARFPDLPIQPLATEGLSDRDAALARAIDHVVARRWMTLVAVLEMRLTRPWPRLRPAAKAALLAGAGQLLLLEKIPDHAAINEAVGWCKGKAGRRMAGMVNAVLRRVAEMRKEMLPAESVPPVSDTNWPLPPELLPWPDGRAWRLSEPVFDDDPVRRLAEQTSHPEPLLAHWMAVHGRARTIELAAHNMLHPPITLIGPGLRELADQPDAPDAVNEPDRPLSEMLAAHDEPRAMIYTGPREALNRLLRERRDIWVQDPAMASAVDLSGEIESEPRLIIDLCAGRGTKTRGLALRHPRAEIIATDIDKARLADLRDLFEDHPQVRVVAFDEVTGVVAAWRGRADLLVLDVPCTNTGAFGRRVEARYRFTPQHLDDLVRLQRQIMADAIPLLAPRAAVLYITCSLEPAENESQAQWLAKWHAFSIVREHRRWPHGLPGEPLARYTDGGYAALLAR